MFREQFREGWDGDIKFVLSVLRYQPFGFPPRESPGLHESGDRGFGGTWVSQRTERDWVGVYNDVSVFLILECPGGNVGWVPLDQGNDFALPAVRCRYNSNAICGLWGTCLERVSKCQ